MKKTLSIFALLMFCLVGVNPAQDRLQPENRLAVVVPQDVYIPVILAQPDCPLKIEKAQLLKYLDGRYEKIYQVRNITSKPITSYTIAVRNSDNSGNEVSWQANGLKDALLPGNSFPPQSSSSAGTIIPLTDSLRTKLDLHSPVKRVLYFMIVDVRFQDGTKYDAKHTLDALEKYLNRFEVLYESEIK